MSDKEISEELKEILEELKKTRQLSDEETDKKLRDAEQSVVQSN